MSFLVQPRAAAERQWLHLTDSMGRGRLSSSLQPGEYLTVGLAGTLRTIHIPCQVPPFRGLAVGQSHNSGSFMNLHQRLWRLHKGISFSALPPFCSGPASWGPWSVKGPHAVHMASCTTPYLGSVLSPCPSSSIGKMERNSGWLTLLFSS